MIVVADASVLVGELLRKRGRELILEDVRIVVELWRRSSRVDGQTVTSSRVS